MPNVVPLKFKRRPAAVAWSNRDINEWMRSCVAAAGGDPSTIEDNEPPSSIPRDEFEATMECEDPPTLTALALRGTLSKPLVPEPEVPPADPAVAARAQTLLLELAAFCAVHDPRRIAKVPQLNADAVGAYAATIEAWLRRFLSVLPTGRAP